MRVPVRPLRSIVALCACLGATLACRAQPIDTTVWSGKLRIVGSNTMEALVADVAAAFRVAYPGVVFELRPTGCERGMEQLRLGNADLSMLARALNDRERELFGFPIARDGVAIAVHGSNPVAALSKQQVAGIFSGRIKNWKEIGGSDAKVNALVRNGDESTSSMFLGYFGIKWNRTNLRADDRTAGELVRALSGDPGSISYLSVALATRGIGREGTLKVLPLEGIAPTAESIRDGSYPLTRSMVLVTRTLPSGLTKAFIEFSLSPAAAKIVERQGYVVYRD